MRRSLRSLSVLLAAVLAALALGPVAPAAPASSAGAEPEPISYVAMGDSFSAGSGVRPLAPGAPRQCLQSARNYPHLVAAALGATLRDVTCGGASTVHFTRAQYRDVPPQLDALSLQTGLVTVGIGGNDGALFARTIAVCGAAGLATLGFGNPCERQQGERLTRLVDETIYPNVLAALQQVHAAAPEAQVVIVGSPWIVPAAFVRSCFKKAPLARGDVPFVRALQARANAAFERAAAETGSTYVDFSAVSDRHDMCQPRGVRWVEPAFGGNNVIHPNALGEAGMAAEVLEVLGAG